MRISRWKLAMGLMVLLIGAARLLPAADDTSWPQARADALRAAQQERDHPIPLRPTALRGVDLDKNLDTSITQAIAKLREESLYSGGEATKLLIYLGDRAAPALADACIAPNGNLSNVAPPCVSILKLRGEKAVEPLARALHAPRPPKPRGVMTFPEDSVHAPIVQALGETRSPKAVPILLEALKNADLGAEAPAVEALDHFSDPAIAPALADFLLQAQNPFAMFVAGNSLMRIDPTGAKKAIEKASTRQVGNSPINPVARLYDFTAGRPPIPTPQIYTAERVAITQLARDAMTYRGEHYGAAEIKTLGDHLFDDPGTPIDSDCFAALVHLKAYDSVPRVMKRIDARDGIAMLDLSTLAQCPSSEVIDNFLEGLRSTNSRVHDNYLQAMTQGANWVMPILFTLLEDANQSAAARSALTGWMIRNGAKTVTVRLNSLNVNNEILKLKQWWASHREDFLSGRPVEYPTQTLIPPGRQ